MTMSKSGPTLTERPLPPSAAERDLDLSAAGKVDVVFSVGQKYLNDYFNNDSPTSNSPSTCMTSCLSSSSSANANNSTSSTTTTSTTTSHNTHNSSTASIDSTNSNPETSSSSVSRQQTQQAYDDVTSLLDSYANLTKVPVELDENYSRLKETSDDLSKSISELKTISLDFNQQLLQDKSATNAKDSHHQSNKSSQKKGGKGNSNKAKNK